MLKLLADETKIQNEVNLLAERQEFKLDSSQEEKVREIVGKIAREGDRALVEYTQKFDEKNFSADKLKVSKEEIEKAYKKVGKAYCEVLAKAIQNITSYHQRQKPDGTTSDST
jgi:histidinol dehydrogenase